MSFSARLAGKLPLLNSRVPLIGVPKSGFVSFLHLNRRLRVEYPKKMAWSSEKSEISVENKVGLVRPATEANAEEAIEALKNGKVIAVPTDTLYGFACDACSLEAVNRIYEIKGRKHTSPLAICVGDVSDIERFAVTDHLPHGLLDALLPGPVTVVLRRGESSILEKSLNPGLESIGVRVPDSSFIRVIARGSESALALTSANLSGQPSSLGVQGSTVVDLTTLGKYKILRAGSAKEETVAILEKHSMMEEQAAN
ncbi:yrdC domain-containing protein, mitochondrial-like [Melia azedarach]|uniref:YrdC domain-containing protein, mitochondrial-like n=1 Tax=Melia azedarach TaxID=155640 RepID=A0ACC1YSL7_MELAZ|nr:yrdC domain-containing protein, mitochondrial-like [Melia azedarach]